MPQESKAMPFDPEGSAETAGVAQLQGTAPGMTSETEVRDVIEKACGYRGDVTVTLKDGRVSEGYLFDRRVEPVFAECKLRIIPREKDEAVSIRYSEVAGLSFSGRDAAAGKSFETWVKKYREKKAAGEKNIG